MISVSPFGIRTYESHCYMSENGISECDLVGGCLRRRKQRLHNSSLISDCTDDDNIVKSSWAHNTITTHRII